MNIVGKIVCLFLILMLFSTYNGNKKNENFSLIFPIKKILIENNKIVSSKKIRIELEYLMGKSLLFFDKNKLKKLSLGSSFISNIKIRKIFPDTIVLIIDEKKPVAIFTKGTNKFYISEKGELIKFTHLDYFRNLPIVFGKVKNFTFIYKDLEKVNFNLNEIEAYYYFDIGRWDIKLKNGRLLKLPNKNYINSLKNYMKIAEDKNLDKYIIFDYRIKDQIILK